jgi:DNA-binding transcriptional LysR family regulator
MELRHLRALVAIADTGSFRAAAERLRIAQPALTRTLADLEHRVGARLLDRGNRGAVPTPAGAALLEDARRLLADAAMAAARAKAIGRGEAGTLRLHFIEAASWAGAFPAALAAFRAAHPAIRLVLTPGSSLSGLAAVREGRADAAACYYAPEDPALVTRRIRNDRVAAILPASDALARRRRIRLAELAARPFVHFPRAVSPGYFDALAAGFAAAGFVPRIVQEAPDQGTMIALVAAGIGVTVANDATRFRQPHGVAVVTLSDLDLRLPLDLVWRRDAAAPALTAFAALLVQCAPPASAPHSARSRASRPQPPR